MSATQRQPFTRFTIDVQPERDVVRVCPRGDVDLATVGAISEQVEDLTATGFRRVVLDLRAVTFIDSTGLRLVLELDAAARDGGWEFGVIDGSRDVARVFDLAGVRSLVPFVEATQIRYARWGRPWR
jgi:anti-sigma B factor antagonist